MRIGSAPSGSPIGKKQQTSQSRIIFMLQLSVEEWYPIYGQSISDACKEGIVYEITHRLLLFCIQYDY